MESTTELFNAVKQLYANKAASDRTIFAKILKDTLDKVHFQEHEVTDTIYCSLILAVPWHIYTVFRWQGWRILLSTQSNG